MTAEEGWESPTGEERVGGQFSAGSWGRGGGGERAQKHPPGQPEQGGHYAPSGEGWSCGSAADGACEVFRRQSQRPLGTDPKSLVFPEAAVAWGKGSYI